MNATKKIMLMNTVVLIAIAVCAVRAQAVVDSMTVEIENTAILIKAESEVIQEIAQRLENRDLDRSDSAEFKKKMKAEYEGKVKLEIFLLPDIRAVMERAENRMFVREAVISGAVPPIEGLDYDTTARLLEAVGFSVMSRDDYESMSEVDIIRTVYISERSLVVISDTGAYEELIFMRNPRDQKAGGAE